MGKYGNIDGVATLTNDAIAKDNVRAKLGFAVTLKPIYD